MTNTIEISPWRLLWPFNRLLVGENLEPFINKLVTVVLLVPEWANVISPGDPIELVDRDDLTPWLFGTVIYTKKSFLRGITAQTLRHSLYQIAKPLRRVMFNDLIELLSVYYDEPVSPDTVVGVIAFCPEKILI